MSDRRRFLKGSTSLPLATVLANPGLASEAHSRPYQFMVRTRR